MITTSGRFPEEPLPRLGAEGAEAPEFPVTFSRPSDLASRSDTRPNTFRWAGSGTIRVMERGLVVIAKRRSALGFFTTEQRLVPAWEIAEVYREGGSVRLDLRGDPRNHDFFQFWAGDASTAGTIVRLLPTSRTIEYEEPPSIAAAHSSEQGRSTASPAARRHVLQADMLLPLALVVVLAGTVALLTTPRLREYISPRHESPASLTPSTSAALKPAAMPPSAEHRPSDVEIANARVLLNRYDDRIDGLRTQFRTAFTALQNGSLSQEAFIAGATQWLMPQWQSLYKDMRSDTQPLAPLALQVRKQLIAVTLSWNGALGEYVRGLQDSNYIVVLGAIDQMSAANEEQQRAWRLIEPREP
jgi:hypothetical protein